MLFEKKGTFLGNTHLSLQKVWLVACLLMFPSLRRGKEAGEPTQMEGRVPNTCVTFSNNEAVDGF